MHRFCVYGGLQLGSSLSFMLLILSIIVSHFLLFSVCIHIILGRLASMAKLETILISIEKPLGKLK